MNLSRFAMGRRIPLSNPSMDDTEEWTDLRLICQRKGSMNSGTRLAFADFDPLSIEECDMDQGFLIGNARRNHCSKKRSTRRRRISWVRIRVFSGWIRPGTLSRLAVSFQVELDELYPIPVFSFSQMPLGMSKTYKKNKNRKKKSIFRKTCRDSPRNPFQLWDIAFQIELIELYLESSPLVWKVFLGESIHKILESWSKISYVDQIAFQPIEHRSVVTLYASFPVIVANESVGLAWYLNMLQGPAMQNLYGSSECSGHRHLPGGHLGLENHHHRRHAQCSSNRSYSRTSSSWWNLRSICEHHRIRMDSRIWIKTVTRRRSSLVTTIRSNTSFKKRSTRFYWVPFFSKQLCSSDHWQYSPHPAKPGFPLTSSLRLIVKKIRSVVLSSTCCWSSSERKEKDCREKNYLSFFLSFVRSFVRSFCMFD